MANLLQQIPEVLLLGPGPSSASDSVYDALSRKSLGYLDPDFIRIMDAVKEKLQKVIGTRSPMTLALQGTGTAGMEACLVNLIEPGDSVLVLINGYFGHRMVDMAERLGAEVRSVEFEWGTPVDPAVARKELGERRYKIMAVVHGETSTGVLNPVEDITAAARETSPETLLMVDAVTTLGGLPVRMDDWGIDVFYSGSQKCLSCPPGLSPVAFSTRAQEALANRKKKVPNWYLDMSLLQKYWSGEKRMYHHTAPMNMIYGLYQALYNLEQEGIEAAHARHRAAHEKLVEGVRELGLEMLVRQESRLPMLNAVTCPSGLDEAAIRGKLRREHLIEIGGGLGALAGKVWRIGLMGHSARQESVDRLIGALKTLLD